MRIAEQEQHQQTIELARVNTLYQQLSREKDETIANLSQKIQVVLPFFFFFSFFFIEDILVL